MMKRLLVTAGFLGALMVAVLAGTQGFGACESTGCAKAPTATTATAPTPTHAAARVQAVDAEPAIGLDARNPAEMKRALALAILFGR